MYKRTKVIGWLIKSKWTHGLFIFWVYIIYFIFLIYGTFYCSFVGQIMLDVYYWNKSNHWIYFSTTAEESAIDGSCYPLLPS